MSPSENQLQQRSTFVTVVAWIFIILSGFGALIGLLQNIMVHTMFSMPEMQTAMNNPETTSQMPPMANFIFSHFRLWVFLTFAMTLLSLISSIGLLKRKNWARVVFIGVLSFAILTLLGSMVAQFFFFPSTSGTGAENIPSEMKTMMNFMQIFFVFFYSGIAILFGWIIKKLFNSDIASEFQA